jgi:hypothetical protein
MRMFKQVLIAAAVAASMSGGIAGAKENTAPPVNREQAPQRYCIVQAVTGSIRATQKVCKTREQWMQEDGIDPTHKQN